MYSKDVCVRRARACGVPVLGGLGAGRGGHGAQADGAQRGAQRRRQRRRAPLARVLVQRARPAELQRVAPPRHAACNNIPLHSTPLHKLSPASPTLYTYLCTNLNFELSNYLQIIFGCTRCLSLV